MALEGLLHQNAQIDAHAFKLSTGVGRGGGWWGGFDLFP